MTEISDLSAQVAALTAQSSDLTANVATAVALFNSNSAAAIELQATKAQIATETTNLSNVTSAIASASATLAGLVPPAPPAQ